MVTRFAVPEQQTLSWWLSVAGIVLLAAHTAGQWRQIGEFARRRQTRYGALAMSGIVLALGIVVAINYILSRQNVRLGPDRGRPVLAVGSDATGARVPSHRPSACWCSTAIRSSRGIATRLGEYEYVSPQVTVEYVDIDRNPVRARQYDVQSYGTIVFEYEGRIERVVSSSEQELTNGLIKAVEGEERTVYFVQGTRRSAIRRAASARGTARSSRRSSATTLAVETVVLAQAGAVPEDATVLVVAGPETDLLPAEADLLRAWLDRGGKLLLMLDPPETADEPGAPNLVALAADWGMENRHRRRRRRQRRGAVAGNRRLGAGGGLLPAPCHHRPVQPADRVSPRALRPAGGGRRRGPDCRGLRGDEPAKLGGARPERAGGGRGWRSTRRPATSPDRSRSPPRLSMVVDDAADGDDEPEPGDGEDGGAAEAGGESGPEADPETGGTVEARLAVFGDSDFASNGAVGIQGNSDLALNALNWLAEQDSLIAIRPREPEDRRITLTADQQARINWLTLLMIPGAILGAGVYTWWSRRQQ